MKRLIASLLVVIPFVTMAQKKLIGVPVDSVSFLIPVVEQYCHAELSQLQEGEWRKKYADTTGNVSLELKMTSPKELKGNSTIDGPKRVQSITITGTNEDMAKLLDNVFKQYPNTTAQMQYMQNDYFFLRFYKKGFFTMAVITKD